MTAWNLSGPADRFLHRCQGNTSGLAQSQCEDFLSAFTGLTCSTVKEPPLHTHTVLSSQITHYCLSLHIQERGGSDQSLQPVPLPNDSLLPNKFLPKNIQPNSAGQDIQEGPNDSNTMEAMQAAETKKKKLPEVNSTGHFQHAKRLNHSGESGPTEQKVPFSSTQCCVNVSTAKTEISISLQKGTLIFYRGSWC